MSVLSVMGTELFVVKSVSAIEYGPQEVADMTDAAIASKTTLDDVDCWQTPGHEPNQRIVDAVLAMVRVSRVYPTAEESHGRTAPGSLRSAGLRMSPSSHLGEQTVSRPSWSIEKAGEPLDAHYHSRLVAY